MEKERIPHDPAYKQFFSNKAMVESLLRDFIPHAFVADLDFSTLERLSGSYVTDDLRERHDDIVWRVGWKNGLWCYVVLILEFQSTPDKYMALRMLSYTTLLLLDLIKTGQIAEGEGLPPVFPIVIYNGARAWKAPQEVAQLFAPMPESLKEYVPRHKHVLIDEGAIKEDELSPKKGLASKLIRLERAQSLEEAVQVIQELKKQLLGDTYTDLRKAFYVWLDKVVFKRSTISKNMQSYDIRAEDAMLAERVDEWIEGYIKQGVLMGRAEGEERGEERGIGVALQDVLEARFGNIPPYVISSLAALSDTNALRRLLRFASRAESLQAFIEHMDNITPTHVQ